MKYLIVGLGNIGAEYENTRHNIGFMVCDRLAAQEKVKFETEKLASVANFNHRGRAIYMIKPTTYMNLSGKAVNYWLQKLKIPIENMLVIVDDLALPFGTFRMRPQGSSAGHNGLKNIELLNGGINYPRLRFGIDDHFAKGRQVEYVLAPFSIEEQKSLSLYEEKACEMILSFASVGVGPTMTKFNN
jgi:PTH1 family peptidyl-tRNA hydrolase